MKYCKKCLQTDTRPGIKFDDYGICPACNYQASLQQVDWNERRKELDNLVAFGKANNHSGYEALIMCLI